MTETPGSIIKYAVLWTLTKGGPIGPDGEDLERNTNGIPIIESEDEDSDETLSPAHTDYKWNSVDLSYSIQNPEAKALKNYNIKAKVFSYNEQVNEDTITGEQSTDIIVINQNIKLDSFELTITSSDPNNGNTWIFPDDYEQIVDPNYPKQYGGVIMRQSDSVTASCGLEDGPDDDGIVPWTDTRGRRQEAFSGYNYIDVFDQSDFKYIPRNELNEIKIEGSDTFRFEPKYPDLKDPDGKAAPIYPMNMVTSFLPDTRESVTVTYTVTMKAFRANNEMTLQNPVVTIKQVCFQDSDNYGDQLDALIAQCNWANPDDISDDDFSPGYIYDYPFTMVNGFEDLGLGDTPTTRPDGSLLARGDVWYDPEEDVRHYFHVGDEPDRLIVKEEGKGYKDKTSVPCVWLTPGSETKEVNGVTITVPPRCYNYSERGTIPYGLLVDTVTKNGKIVSASISADAEPKNFQDGDLVTITGGNNQATLEVKIDTPANWRLTYTEKDESNRSEL